MAATADRVFSVLRLFSTDQPEWTVEAIASKLHLSASTAYQYVGSLVKVGLLVSGATGIYSLGPAVIELDRVVRRTDPLTCHGRTVLRDLVRSSDEKVIGLTCRLYRLKVMCIDQFAPNAPDIETSYERGRPMPLFRGAASKVILANLSARSLRPLFDRVPQEFAQAGLGPDWDSLKEQMRVVRKSGAFVTVGELDPGAMGISAPVFGEDKTVVGSIGLVVSAASVASHSSQLERLCELVRHAGENVTAAMHQ